jgi:20S proteasome alpha/beta subunit
MTLVVAIPSTGFIVLGADSRGTIEDPRGVTRVEVNILKKLIRISDHVGILIYGSAKESIFLVEQFQSTLRPNIDGVTQIARDFAAFCRNEARLYADVPHQNSPNFGFVIAGLDKKGSKYIPKAYSLHSSNGYVLGKYPHYAVEGKPMIALYLLTTHFREGMNFDDVCKLVAIVLNETRKVDGDVGGRLRMAVIDEEGYREISNRDIKEYLKDSEKEWLPRNLENTDGVLSDDEAVT